MSIMKCPRCEGGGYIYEGGWVRQTSAAQQQIICPSCGGKGYVTDEQIHPDNSPDKVGTRITWVSPIVTREPERIARILASIRVIWQRFPDWRLGQLLVNAIPEFEKHLFSIEDTTTETSLDKFEGKIDEGLDKFLENMG